MYDIDKTQQEENNPDNKCRVTGFNLDSTKHKIIYTTYYFV